MNEKKAKKYLFSNYNKIFLEFQLPEPLLKRPVGILGGKHHTISTEGCINMLRVAYSEMGEGKNCTYITIRVAT